MQLFAFYFDYSEVPTIKRTLALIIAKTASLMEVGEKIVKISIIIAVLFYSL